MQMPSNGLMVDWQPGNPIPFADYDNERDEPPEGLTAEDIQLSWWRVAASLSRDEVREKLLAIVWAHTDWSYFVYQPIADHAGSCRYPWPLIDLL